MTLEQFNETHRRLAAAGAAEPPGESITPASVTTQT
jgi:hypothetical protein